MIIGIGTDILDLKRVLKIIEKHGNFAIRRLMTSEEINYYDKKDNVKSFAKVFSMKESVIKCISNVNFPSWQSIEILHDSFGKPFVKISDELEKKFLKKIKILNLNNFLIHISVSDENEFVSSFCIIEAF